MGQNEQQQQERNIHSPFSDMERDIEEYNMMATCSDTFTNKFTKVNNYLSI